MLRRQRATAAPLQSQYVQTRRTEWCHLIAHFAASVVGENGAVLKAEVRNCFEFFAVAAAVFDPSLRGCRCKCSEFSGLQLGAGVPLLPVDVQLSVLGRHWCRQLGQSSPRLPLASQHRRTRWVDTGSRQIIATDPQDSRGADDRRPRSDRCEAARWATVTQCQ